VEECPWMHQRVYMYKCWSRMEQEVGAEWRSEAVPTRQQRCAMMDAGGCSRSEQSRGVNQYTPDSRY
jgi:hypothetical protein